MYTGIIIHLIFNVKAGMAIVTWIWNLHLLYYLNVFSSL